MFHGPTLGERGEPRHANVYLRGENRFYTFTPETRIYIARRVRRDISARLSACCFHAPEPAKEDCDVDALEFCHARFIPRWRTVKRRSPFAPCRMIFSVAAWRIFCPVGNGVLHITDRTLLPFSPKFHFRNKLAVITFWAKYPTFENVLLGNSLDFDDVGLCAAMERLALVGRNISPKVDDLSARRGQAKNFHPCIKGIIGEQHWQFADRPA